MATRTLILLCRWRILSIRSQNWARESGLAPLLAHQGSTVPGRGLTRSTAPVFASSRRRLSADDRERCLPGAGQQLINSDFPAPLYRDRTSERKNRHFHTPIRCGRDFRPAPAQSRRCGQTSRRCSGLHIAAQHHHIARQTTRAPEINDNKLDFPTPSGPISRPCSGWKISGEIVQRNGSSSTPAYARQLRDRRDGNQFQMRHCGNLTTRSVRPRKLHSPAPTLRPASPFSIFQMLLE